jgi:MFS family permease
VRRLAPSYGLDSKVGAVIPIAESLSNPKRDIAARRIVLAVSLGAFLTSFDAGAVNAVLPSIRHAFGCGISGVQWVLTADLLVISGLLLVFGRLGDVRGPRAIYLIGFAVFLCGCALCAVCPSTGSLIACRAFQGIGSAMLLANSPSLLVRHLPAAVRGFGFGVKTSCIYLGLMVGPAAGGWLVTRSGWRAVFAVEVPAAIMGLAVAAISIPADRPGTQRARYDFAGACLWFLALTSFLWLLAHHESGPLRACGLSAALLLVILVAAQRRNSEPLFARYCFRTRGFSASVLSLASAFTASYMLTFVLPFLIVEGRNQSISVAGGVLAVYALARSSVAWWSGRCSDRIDARLLAVPGLILFVCGIAILSRLGERSPISAMTAALAVAGIGFGCFVPPNNNALMASAPRELYGFASGIMATSRTVGMTIGVALAGAILSAAGGPLAGRADKAFCAAALLALAAAIASIFATPPPRRRP